MNIKVRRVLYEDIRTMRDLYRKEANCQIIHDSALPRGFADPYLIEADGRIAGYGAVWNKYFEGRVMEFYTEPLLRGNAVPMFLELLAVSGATHIEAQTNMPLMLLMLFDLTYEIVTENILFHDAFTSQLPSPGTVFFRRARPDGEGAEENEWVLEADGAMVATGGYLCHYNPPYGDVYMETAEPMRGRGYGSYLVQELKRAVYEAGRLPAARCAPDNAASRRTMEKAGLLPCGRLLAGAVNRRQKTTSEAGS